MTQKVLECTVENKRRNAQNLEKKLWHVVRAVKGTGFKLCTSNMKHELKNATQEFDLIISEIANLYSQDVHRLFKGEATLMPEKLSLHYALELLHLIKNATKSYNFPHMDSNIPANPAYGVYISQLVRYAKICTSKVDFMNRLRGLSLRLRQQGFLTLPFRARHVSVPNNRSYEG